MGVTSGSVHDATVMQHLIRDDDTAVYGDKGYASGARKRAAEAAGVLWSVKEKGTSGRRLTVRQCIRNRRFGKVRAKVEHVFRVMKCHKLGPIQPRITVKRVTLQTSAPKVPTLARRR